MLQMKAETEVHKKIVGAVIAYFKEQGWRITAAACPGYTEPGKVERHEPDVIARDGRGVTVYGEAKTGEGDIGARHSREQYHDFSKWFMKGSGMPCPLYICVPGRHRPELERVLREEGLAGKPNIHVLVYG